MIAVPRLECRRLTKRLPPGGHELTVLAGIDLAIAPEMMKSERPRGLSFMTAGLAGSVASASAAKVSMMRFTQSIWMTLSGIATPMKGPSKAIVSAATLMVSWKTMKRWILR